VNGPSEVAGAPQKLVIVGAGFAGLELAKRLKNQPLDVLLIDRNNYHCFQPLLYQVASGGLEPDSISYPVRRVFRGYDNVHFQMSEIIAVDSARSVVQTAAGDVSYDILVLATGSGNNFFNLEPIKDNFLPLKSITDALNIRSFLMQNLERAVVTYDPSERSELINIAIVGGGASGIELAGALAEMKRHVLPKDFPQIDFTLMSINLYEAGPRLLPAMSESASNHAQRYLTQLGVNVELNSTVTGYDDCVLTLKDNSTFHTDSVIWTAGVKGAPPGGIPDNLLLGNRRIVVDEYFRIESFDNIYAIGDVACQQTKAYPKGHPMLGVVAIKQAQYLAKQFTQRARGGHVKPFRFRSKGSMVTIGRNKAVVDLRHIKLNGVIAWFVWMLVHIMSLVGFRNKLVALIGWSYNYLNYDRPLGLIIRPYRKNNSRP